MAEATAGGSQKLQQPGIRAESPMAPRVEVQTHRPPYYSDNKKEVSISRFIKQNPEQMKFVQGLIDGLAQKQFIPSARGELGAQHRLRILDEVYQRVKFAGDFRGKSDPLYEMLEKERQNIPHITLMAIEAQRASLMKEVNEETSDENKRAVRTKVAHSYSKGLAEVAGDYETAYDMVEGGKPEEGKHQLEFREMPKKDLYAFTLVADKLLDQPDLTIPPGADGKRVTYREQMKKLLETVQDKVKPQDTRDATSNELVTKRDDFYGFVIEALRNVDNKNPEDLDPAVQPMVDILKQIRSSKDIAGLLEGYVGVIGDLKIGRKMNMIKALNDTPQHILEYALKGADLMDRRISYSANKVYKEEEIPTKIHEKDFFQPTVPETLRQAADITEKKPAQEPSAGSTVSLGEQPPIVVNLTPDKVPVIPSATTGVVTAEPIVGPAAEAAAVIEPTPPYGKGYGRGSYTEPRTRSEPKLPGEVEFKAVSAKQRIEHIDEKKKVAEMEVLEERLREIARLRMTEDRNKWEGRFSFLKSFPERFWKYTIGDVATYNKEKAHALKLLAEAGIQITTLPYAFLQDVDVLARANIKAQRKGIFKKAWGGIKDLAHEMTFTEKQLHKERLNIIRQLRAGVEKGTKPETLTEEEKKFIAANDKLFTTYSSVLTGDFKAAEGFAQRLTDKFAGKLIHEVVGEKIAGKAVRLTEDVERFFKQDVVGRLLREGLSSPDGKIKEATLMEVRMQIQEFFFKPEFVKWYGAQPDEVKKALDLSLSYGTDIIPMVQEVLLPQALQAKDYLDSAANLENYIESLVLKVHVGTLESGQKGTVQEGVLERAASRTIDNQRVMKLYQRIRDKGAGPKLVPDTYLDAAYTRSNLIADVARVAGHQVVAGFAAGVGLYAARAGASWAGRLAVPVIGGSAVSGFFRAAQERRLFTREYEQHEVEKETGYTFAKDARRREQMQGLERHKRQMQTELTDPIAQGMERMTKGEKLEDAEVMKLMGLIADTDARLHLADIRGVGLLASNNPQTYQIERSNLELTKAQAKVDLRTYLSGNQQQLINVLTKLRFITVPPGQDANDIFAKFKLTIPKEQDTIDFVIGELTAAQEQNLKTGAVNTNLSAALKDLTVEQKQSIDVRERAFRARRRYRMVRSGLTTAAMGIGGYFVSHEVINLAGKFALSHDIPVISGFLNKHGWTHTVQTGTSSSTSINPLSGGLVQDQAAHLNLNLPSNFHETITGNQLTITDNGGANHVFDLVRDAKGNITGMSAVDPNESLIAHLQAGASHDVIRPPDLTKMTPGENLALKLKTLLSDNKEMAAHRMVEVPSSDKNFHVLWPERVQATGDHAGHELELHLNDGRDPITGQWFANEKGVINFAGGSLKKGLIDPYLSGLQPKQDMELERLIDLNGGKNITHEDLFAFVKLRNGSDVYLVLDDHGKAILPENLLDAAGKPNPNLIEYIGVGAVEKSDGSGLIKATEWWNSGHPPMPVHTEHFLASVRFEGEELPLVPSGTTVTDFSPANLTFDLKTETYTPIFEDKFVGTDAGLPFLWARRPLEAPEGIVGETPKIIIDRPPPVQPPPYGGYGEAANVRKRLEEIAIDQSKEERDKQNIPILLPVAFQKWDITPEEQQRVKNLTLPEQLDWLTKQAKDHGVNLSPAQTQNIIDSIAAALNITLQPSSQPSYSSSSAQMPPRPSVSSAPTPSVPAASPAAAMESLTLFIADEQHSPVAESNRAEAINQANKFSSLGDLEEAERRGGLTKTESLNLYQDMVTWMSSQNLIDLVKDDPGFDPTIYQEVQNTAQDFLWDDPVEAKKFTNTVMRFINQYNSKFHMLEKGDIKANLYVILAAYDRIRGLQFVPRTSP